MATTTAGKLLIVDDEASVRHALERLLRKEGYEVQSACDASDADRILETDKIDVILCDQDMPGRTGIEFLVDAAKKYPHQRRLMISGRFQSSDVAQAMDSGAIHKFMMKPWDDAILKADIRSSFRQIMNDFVTESRNGIQNNADRGNPETHIDNKDWAEFEEDRILTKELHSAANDGSLSLVYQPQIDLESERIDGFEALLRWNSTTGPVSPERFINLAERGGSMSRITHWVFREVCHRTFRWIPNWNCARIGLNISAVDLRDDSFLDHVESTLDRYSIPKNALQIEVTESQALKCDGAMTSRLDRLVNLGVSLAIDDFGAGATTLSYLADLPFSTLKIDRSLTQQITNPKGLAVVQKVIEIAKCLEMKTTIEGVETAEEVKLARSLGASTAQGYFFSKPRPSDDIGRWIDDGCHGTFR